MVVVLAVDMPGVSAATVARLLEAAGVSPHVMVDASHGNSERDHLRQLEVVSDLAGQIAEGQRGIVGVMIESFLVAGRQELPTIEDTNAPSAGTQSHVRDRLTFGQSITDPCIGWEETEQVLDALAQSVRARRASQREGQVASTRR